MEMDTKSDVKKHLDRFQRLFPKTDDFSLIILKGHLLIEEIINRIFDSKCQHPEFFEKAKLSFYQKVQILRALSEYGDDSSNPWNSLLSLNSIRNKIAHNIEPENLNNGIDDFIFARFNKKRMVEFANSEERITGLIKEFFILSGYMEAYSVKEKRV